MKLIKFFFECLIQYKRELYDLKIKNEYFKLKYKKEYLDYERDSNWFSKEEKQCDILYKNLT